MKIEEIYTKEELNKFDEQTKIEIQNIEDNKDVSCYLNNCSHKTNNKCTNRNPLVYKEYHIGRSGNKSPRLCCYSYTNPNLDPNFKHHNLNGTPYHGKLI